MKDLAKIYFWLSFSPWFLFIVFALAGWFNPRTAPLMWAPSLFLSGLGLVLLVIAKVFKFQQLIQLLVRGTIISFSFIILMLILDRMITF